MMKKVLYGVALTLLAGASVGTLQSCKDDVEDLKTQTAFDLEQLRKNLEGVHQGLQDQITNNRNDVNKLFHLLDQYAKVTWVESMLKNLQDNIYANINNIGNQISHINGEIVRINGEISTLQGKVDYLTQEDAKLLAMIQGALSSIQDLNNKYTDLNGKYTDLSGKYSDLNGKYDALKTDVDGLTTTVNGLSSQVNTNTLKIAALEGRVGANENAIIALNTAINRIDGTIADVLNKINTMESNFNGQIDAVNGRIDVVDGKVDAINLRLDGVDSSIDGLNTAVSGLNSALNGLSLRVDVLEGDLRMTKDNVEQLKEQVYFLAQKLSQLQNDFDNLSGNVDSLAQKVQEIEDKITEISGRIDNLVTGILVQGTDNPIFGNFSLPLGIKSNLLFNWFGYHEGRGYQFPSTSNTTNYDPDAAPLLTAADLTAAGVADYSKESIPQGLLGEVSLGKVYLTVNPIGHNFDNTAFKLETTNGEQLPYELRINKSNEKLFWGYSRAEEGIGNGFYEADVVMPAEWGAINQTKIEIEPGLKTAMKDALKDRTKRNAVNLLKALYAQMSDMLPVYGVRYDWTYAGQPYAVLSGYDLAVATARPLSYGFLADYGELTSRRLPIHGHIENIFKDLINKDDFKFKLNTNFEIEGFTISFEDLTFDLKVNPDITLDKDIVVTIHIPEQKASGKDSFNNDIEVTVPAFDTDATITQTDLQPLIEAIAKGFADSIERMNGELNTQINAQIREKLIAGIQNQVNKMLDDIQSQINKMLADLESQINGQISDMIDNIQASINDKTGGLFNKVNDAIDIYNRVAEKINNFIAHPNTYLQVAMFYKGNGTVGLLSNKKSDPTVFVNGGGNALSLYASSYTGEIVAPAYKKFIAVTNVYNADGSVNTAAKAKLPEVNAKSGLAKVFPGFTKRVGVLASQLEKGLTYEIVYQGVDYSGVTSTQKFYIKVK